MFEFTRQQRFGGFCVVEIPPHTHTHTWERKQDCIEPVFSLDRGQGGKYQTAGQDVRCVCFLLLFSLLPHTKIKTIIVFWTSELHNVCLLCKRVKCWNSAQRHSFEFTACFKKCCDSIFVPYELSCFIFKLKLWNMSTNYIILWKCE